ncbi:MAG: nucleotidyltransferase domain-containing protein [Acidobacteriota bacterium]
MTWSLWAETRISLKAKLRSDVRVDEIILFGSRVQGKTGRDTDVDLVIVSPDFEGMDFFQRGAKMYDHWDLDYPVDFLCYTPEEFDKLKKRTSMVSEAAKTGVAV